MILNDQIKEIQDLLLSHKNIVVTTHKNVDGDAIGSSLAIKHFLTTLKHYVSVIILDEIPDFLSWLPQAEEIIIYQHEQNNANNLIKQADLIFCLDFNDLTRLGSLSSSINNAKALKILIDHHQNPKKFADFIISNSSKNSTCEMVYDFIDNLNQLKKLDKNIATCIYTGIMTDTQSFKFNTVTAHTHRIIAKLIENNIDVEQIYQQVYEQNKVIKMKLLAKFLSSLTIVNSHSIYGYLTAEDFNKNGGFNKTITEGFIDYCLKLTNIKLAGMFIENQAKQIVKISLRSKGNIAVNEMASKYFVGGGHNNAAGAETKESLKTVIDIFKNNLANKI